jgi:diadenosine tetraphosphate (Ap4A) HIT family hydrolase
MNDADDCVFCEIIEGARDATILFEDEKHICILDKYPVTEGHTLVIPKAHIKRFNAVDDWSMYESLERAVDQVRDRYEPDAMNIGLNDGPVAGQTIPHLHWHIIPRYEGDIEDPTGGVRGVIPSKRTY